jgi:small ligand-binding sensory domain FIST
MKIRDFLATRTETVGAIEEISSRARDVFGDDPPDLALVFYTPHHLDTVSEIGPRLMEGTGVKSLLGCSAESVIAGNREVERHPAMAVWLARLPGVEIRPLHLEHSATEESPGFRGLPDDLADASARDGLVVLLGDPFSFPVDDLIREFNEDDRPLPIVGGMASGATSPGYNRLLLGTDVHGEGAVAVHLRGALAFRTVVSQGCRPVGRRYVVTAADRNLIVQLAGRPVSECINELLQEMPDSDRFLFEKGPHLGYAIDEHMEEFKRGDFLIRNILGWDPESGGLAVNDFIRRG